MPLIILTGYPCSGLTYRAQQLATRLEETQSQLVANGIIPPSKSKYKIHIVSTHDNVNYPRTVYDTARPEKEARGVAYTKAKRMLGRDSFVILDGMNYIKGYRYQLWCEAKALGTTCCVVHVGTPIDQCIAINEARLRKKNASQPDSAKENKDENPTPATNPSSSPDSTSSSTESKDESDPYPPDLLNNLIYRYEEPSMNSRWDKPLFTVPYTDAEPPIAEIWTALTGIPHPETQEKGNTISELAASLTSTTISPSSAASTTTTTPGASRGGLSSRPRVAIKPHQATVAPATADSSALYNMEKRTSAIIQAIRSFTLANPSAKAALASSKQQQQASALDDEDFTRQEEGIRIPVPDSSTPVFIPAHIASGSVTDDLAAAGGILALPRLQRLRRQWISLNRAYIAGPHAAVKGGGGLREGEIGDAFVRFLNADFADEVEER
ncbi:putative RNA polymerase II Elongator complex associated protein Kti12 [Aspergillus foveolatus]|uniref:putative RNA polymerase II Elongator complex associated protein Kti12 n=1 Tax=Aspergillus foveolatus TaxID=210207 RepID=UPI003CCDB7CD